MINKGMHPDSDGFYGEFGGAYIPEMLIPNVEELKSNAPQRCVALGGF